MFVSNKAMMMMLNGEEVSPYCVAALSGALTFHALALHAAEIYRIYLIFTLQTPSNFNDIYWHT